MSLLARAIAPQARDTVTYEWQSDLLRFGGNPETEGGAVVTPDTAMRFSAFYACVRVLAEGIAQVPCMLYRRTATGKERATDHPLYTILHDAPNDWQTAFEFWELMQVCIGIRGNAFALKTVVRGELRELLPIAPDRVTVTQDSAWNITYKVSMPDGSILDTPPARMFHVPGLSFNGLMGLSPIQYHKETIGLGLQLMRHGARLFRNGAQLGGVLQHPNTLSDLARKHLRESFDEQYAGVSNAHKTLLLEEGMKYEKVAMTSEEAQYLETRKFTRSEVASIFRIPPHMIGELDRATFTNIEQQALEFVKYTMGPWYRRYEQRIWKQLIPKANQETLYAEFLAEAMLRGDTKSRYDGYASAITNGWMNRNEVREKENLNREDGLDAFLTPITAQPGSIPDDDAPVPPDTQTEGDET